MADSSAPKVRLLATIGLLAVFLLVGMKFALDSYWSITTEGYAKELLTPNTELDELRAKQEKDLNESPIPINAAMKQLASKGREGASANITPQQSEDLDPMRGWASLKKDVAAPAPTNVVPAELGDGGALSATDGGTEGDASAVPAMTDAGAPHVATDAGAPHAPPPPPPPHVPAPAPDVDGGL